MPIVSSSDVPIPTFRLIFYTALVWINFQSTYQGSSNYVLMYRVYNKSITDMFIGCPVQRHLWRSFVSFLDHTIMACFSRLISRFFSSNHIYRNFQRTSLFTFLESANIFSNNKMQPCVHSIGSVYLVSVKLFCVFCLRKCWG